MYFQGVREMADEQKLYLVDSVFIKNTLKYFEVLYILVFVLGVEIYFG
jgi:hypothetical protein